MHLGVCFKSLLPKVQLSGTHTFLLVSIYLTMNWGFLRRDLQNGCVSKALVQYLSERITDPDIFKQGNIVNSFYSETTFRQMHLCVIAYTHWYNCQSSH